MILKNSHNKLWKSEPYSPIAYDISSSSEKVTSDSSFIDFFGGPQLIIDLVVSSE